MMQRLSLPDLEALRELLRRTRAEYAHAGPTYSAVSACEAAYHALRDAAVDAGEDPDWWTRAG
jgi:hypothetical protein